jgi:hypothetical protein
MSMNFRRIAPLLLLGLAALAFAACGSKARAGGGVIIEPIDTATPRASVAAAHAEPTLPGSASATPADAADAQPAGAPPADLARAELPTPEPAADPTEQALRPVEGRWIEVDVTQYVVRLMDGDTVLRTIGPVAVGAQVDSGAYESTQTGLFHVYNKQPDLAFDPPYNTYITDWVGFDADRANGFHSFLEDKDGKIVDASTGRVSNGCIRTPDPAAITGFAEIGMPVWVHA